MKETKRITIKPCKLYKISADGKDLGEFKKTSEWRGLIELTSTKNGGIMIATDSESHNFFERIMGIEEREREIQIVKISPSLALDVSTEGKASE